MSKYRAIVSIEFDQDDLDELCGMAGIDSGSIDPSDAISGCMDDLPFGYAWIEQLYQDGRETILRLSDGISVDISSHEL